jgi:TonB family protein
MKLTYSVGGFGVAAMILALGCATGGMDPSPDPDCQDRTRIGIPAGRPQPLMSEVEHLVQVLGLAEADLIPLSDPPPGIVNRREVSAALMREYPPLLRGSGISGTARVAMLVTESGRVEHAEVSEGTGNPGLDQAALRVAKVIEFSEVRTDGAPICYVMAIPVSFAAR